MTYFVFMAVACACTYGAIAGWWRFAFIAFAIRPRRMTVARLGLAVEDSDDVRRVDAILRCFVTAFNRAIARPRASSWIDYCDTIPALHRPFAHEGGALGYTLRRLFRYDPIHFEQTIVRPRPEFRYLYYVGLGFWSGLRRHSAGRLAEITDRLDPLHRFLCFDGYGFARTFFESRENPALPSELNRLEGYRRNAAYQGVGRALYFLYMGEPDLLVSRIRALGDYAADAAAGVGLAAVFVNPDRLEAAQRLAAQIPSEWQAHFHLGMCFGLKARSINDLGQFERDLSRLPKAVQDAAWASIRECDRIELLVRSESDPDGYKNWRARVTAWMSERIEYPLKSVREYRPAFAAENGGGEGKPAFSRTRRIGR